MSNLCERWKDLLVNLIANQVNAELFRLSADEAEVVREHVASCDKCMDDIPMEVLVGKSDELVMDVLMTVGEFMSAEEKDMAIARLEIETGMTISSVSNANLRAQINSERKSLASTIAGFIARHPKLNFGNFFLPNALSPLAAFKAADTIALLLRRANSRYEETGSFKMSPDGSFQMIGKVNRIPATSVIGEIGRCLSPWDYFIPTDPNKHPMKEYEEFRKQHQDDKGRDTIIPCLLAWLFAALAVSPGLMYGYRARPSDTGKEWILEPFGKDEFINNEDKYKPWLL